MYIPCTFHVPHYLRQLVPRLTPHGSTANMKKLGSQAFVTRQQVYRKMGHDGINMPDWFQVVSKVKKDAIPLKISRTVQTGYQLDMIMSLAPFSHASHRCLDFATISQ